ncbi:hypothetical protein GCM10011613_35840 [Cellvibrio zantedeschiae]|uniref:Uncharacterized protein n=1 Tax=Cellvibrio zantedeschiae TaxID=1237077 RepID=A0ABQ3BA80_9GAMM|nr:hypothetical protein [Cellvibrio zantedeschiae]GGY87481.1 hypothetical protein GCM10011613_35840 [Cellvibrio zantedeschiae]
MKYIFTLLLLFFSFSIHAEEINWDFITLGKAASSKPAWSVSRGKAKSISDGKKIIISVFYRIEVNSGGNVEYYPDPQLIIEATIRKNGKILAKAFPQSTDQSEFELVGTYEKYAYEEEWEGVKKIVTR